MSQIDRQSTFREMESKASSSWESHTETSSENTTRKADKREIAVGDGKGTGAQPGDPCQQHPWEVLLTVATVDLR